MISRRNTAVINLAQTAQEHREQHGKQRGSYDGSSLASTPAIGMLSADEEAV